MIYTVTFNPALDYIAEIKNYSEGRVNRTDNERLFPGGKGINVSIVLKNLGIDSVALGFAAGFTGEMLKSMLDEQNVKHDFVLLEDGFTRINVKLKTGRETEINGRGPFIPADKINELMSKISLLADGDTLVLSGSVPASVNSNIYCEIMSMLKCKNINIAVDAEGELLSSALKHRPFLIKPNHHELGDLFGKTLETHKETAEYAVKLQKEGARNVLVSMGGKGAVLVCEDGKIFESGAPEGEAVNTTGAGDSMVAGFIAGLDKGYENAFYTGIAAGSASAFSGKLAEAEGIKNILKTMQR